MTASVEMIGEVRRMTNKPTTTTYSDELMAVYIERYHLHAWMAIRRM